MKKADFLKAAGSVSPHVTAQIEWLEEQDYGDHDQAWLQALDVLNKERSALWEKIEDMKARFQELEQLYPYGSWSVQENARESLQEHFGTRWPETEEQLIHFWSACCDEDSMRESHEAMKPLDPA
jgi:hypothetical protein